MSHNAFNSLRSFDLGNGQQGEFYSLPALAEAGLGDVSRLPVCIRLVLESVLRNCDGQKVTEENIRQLAGWQAKAQRTEEIPFTVARIVLQDFTGVPLLVDLAAMRSAAARLGKDPKDHRAVGAGRLGGRPLGAGGLRRIGGCDGQESRLGVYAQPRALPVSEVGHAGV